MTLKRLRARVREWTNKLLRLVRLDVGGIVIDLLPTQLAMQTRRGNQIANSISREPMRWGDQQEMADIVALYGDQQHRPVGPSRKYNCHGLSFASRRSAIWDPAEVGKIIQDDEYVEIPENEVMPGDTVVYYEQGDASHSGIVLRINELRVPIILSKWGHCHEVIHQLGRCPYKVDDVHYYRIRI